jgi:hypothetical protein
LAGKEEDEAMAKSLGRFRVTDAPGGFVPLDATARATMRERSAPRRAATHTHIHVHTRDQLREDPQAVAGLRSPSLRDPQPDPELFADGTDCAVRQGDRFRVTRSGDAGFELRRDGTHDEGGQTLLQQPELGMGWPAEPETVASAVQMERQSDPATERVLGDRQRIRRIGDAALADLGRPRDACDDIAANAEMQRRLDAFYGQRR